MKSNAQIFAEAQQKAKQRRKKRDERPESLDANKRAKAARKFDYEG